MATTKQTTQLKKKKTSSFVNKKNKTNTSSTQQKKKVSVKKTYIPAAQQIARPKGFKPEPYPEIKTEVPIPDSEEINILKEGNCYNGNIALKLPEVELPLTKEMIAEFEKCKNDVMYFINNYVFISSLDHGIMLFSTFKYQKNLIEIFEKNRFTIAMLPRQMGKTTIVVGFLLWKAIFSPNISIGILANKEDTAKEILGRFQFSYKMLPWWIKPGVREWNKKSIVLSNGKKGVTVFIGACSPDSLRGRSTDILVLDEFSTVPNAEEFYESSYPVVSSGTKSKIIILSTPKGMNLFYKLWKGAEEGTNSYVPYFAPFWHHPARDKEWEEITRKSMSDQSFGQEYLCSFQMSSLTLIRAETLLSLNAKQEILSLEHYKEYQSPEESGRYVVSVDVSEGLSQDYSVITVIRIDGNKYKQVAVWRDNHTRPEELSPRIVEIAKRFNNAFVLVESNSIGYLVGSQLYYDYEYENLYVSVQKYGETAIKEGAVKQNVGVKHSTKTKALGCSRLKSLIEEERLIINDDDTIEELRVFVKEKNSYQADKGYNDDIVMTLVSFAWLTTKEEFQNMRRMERKSYSLDSFSIPASAFRHYDAFAYQQEESNEFLKENGLSPLVLGNHT